MSKEPYSVSVDSNPLNLSDGYVFVIAEAACNHMCSIPLAKAMIDCAADCGVDAIKFQTYKGERLVTKDAPAFWGTETMKQTEYYKRLDRFDAKDYALLFAYAQERNVLPFSTPFSIEDATMLNDVGMAIFKIPSFEIINLDLIRHISCFGKPTILSTGAATIDEIDAAIDVFVKNNDKLTLMACTLSYPTPDDEANFRRIQTLKHRYPNFMIGMSDHTCPDDNMVIPALAVALGARIIEKHYTMSRSMTGSGHFFSVEPSNLMQMVYNIRLCEKILGDGIMGTANCEQRAKDGGRKSIVAARDIGEGEILTANMLRYKRPGTGMCPSRVNEIVGRIAGTRILLDEMIKEESLQPSRSD